jgi:hypothetical protein
MTGSSIKILQKSILSIVVCNALSAIFVKNGLLFANPKLHIFFQLRFEIS